MRAATFASFLASAAISASAVCAGPAPPPPPPAAAPPAGGQFNPASYPKNFVLTADVVVLGGGSAGTYAAIALKDAGKSVVVVEKQNRLGGHFETYTDPATNIPVDYGVQVIWNTTVVRNFFARFGIPIVNFVPPPVPVVVADFTTGQNVSGVQTESDFTPYSAQVLKYPEVDYATNYTNPPPSDFSLPFSQFVTKYGLQSEAFAIYTSPACSGLGNILNQPTLTVFRCLNAITFDEGAGDAIVTASGNYSALFAKAQAELGSSVLLSSTVISAQRAASSSSPGVAVEVQTPSGTKLVLAKQILVAYPQTASNMAPLGLDSKESPVFSAFTYNAWYTGLVKNTGLAVAEYLNAGAKTTYNIPNLPGLYHIAPTADPGLYNFWYGADSAVSQSQVQSDLFAAINKLTGKTQSPQIVTYSDHTPYNLHFDASHIQAGYYAQFDSLQGYRDTWYTGAVLSLPSGPLWVTTQGIVSQIVAAIAKMK